MAICMLIWKKNKQDQVLILDGRLANLVLVSGSLPRRAPETLPWLSLKKKLLISRLCTRLCMVLDAVAYHFRGEAGGKALIVLKTDKKKKEIKKKKRNEKKNHKKNKKLFICFISAVWILAKKVQTLFRHWGCDAGANAMVPKTNCWSEPWGVRGANLTWMPITGGPQRRCDVRTQGPPC